MAITLRPATEADIPGIVAVSSAAFDPSTDAITRRLFPSSQQGTVSGIREWSIFRKSARLYVGRSVVMVAIDETDGAVVGYSMWFAPQEEREVHAAALPPPPPKRDFEGFDREAATELRRIMEDDGREIFGEKSTDGVWSELLLFTQNMLEDVVALTHKSDLDSLGVHPDQQKRGIGMKLLLWGVEKAKSQGRDCYLVATPAGVPLYKAAGFERIRGLDIFGTEHVSMILKCGG